MSNITVLTHQAAERMFRLEVFNGVANIPNLVKAINKASKDHEILTENPDDPTENQKKFRGDAFEVFGEYFCAVFALDIRVGVLNQKVIEARYDIGVDLIGESTLDGKPVSVQFKFKGDPVYEFVYRDLATWLSTSHWEHGVTEQRNLILITTGNTINRHLIRVAGNMRIINRGILTSMIGENNLGFWQGFKDSLADSVKQSQNRTHIKLHDYQEAALLANEHWFA